MADSQKRAKMNGNDTDQKFSSSLKKIKSILLKILPKETAFKIIKVLPMYPSRTIT